MKVWASVDYRDGVHRNNTALDSPFFSFGMSPEETAAIERARRMEAHCRSLANCYGNLICREAARRGIGIEEFEVATTGQFDNGTPGLDVTFHARVVAGAADDEIRDLMLAVAPTSRAASCSGIETRVTLGTIEAIAAAAWRERHVHALA